MSSDIARKDNQRTAPQERMKILFLSHRFPFPAIGGDRVKAYHLLRHLGAHHDVDLITLDEANTVTPESSKVISDLARTEVIAFDKVKAALRILKALPSRTPLEFAYYHADEMQRAVDRAIEKARASKPYDLVVCFFLRTADYVTHVTDIPKLLIAEDARIILQERASQRFELSPQWIVRKIEASRLGRYEPKTMAKGFDLVTFVAREDQKRILASDRTIPTAILSNGVDTESFTFEHQPTGRSIVFTGHLGVYHNVLMVERLAREIYPSLREKFADLKLVIVGKDPSSKLRELIGQTNGAELHADVPDVKPYIRNATVFVHPQSVGAGIQNKLLETMALGTPVVTTPVGASGIEGMVDGVHALIRKESQEIARAVEELLLDSARCDTLARNARSLIEDRYTWTSVFHTLDSLMMQVISQQSADSADSHRVDPGATEIKSSLLREATTTSMPSSANALAVQLS